jgi:hypothetical protein
MKFRNSFLPITVLLLIFGHFSISNAYAYLDPGTGSIIAQMIIGTLVGAGLAIKIYWQKIKMKFMKK